MAVDPEGARTVLDHDRLADDGLEGLAEARDEGRATTGGGLDDQVQILVGNAGPRPTRWSCRRSGRAWCKHRGRARPQAGTAEDKGATLHEELL
jgi:hypothetical protein